MVVKVSYYCLFCQKEKRVILRPNLRQWTCCEAEGHLIQEDKILHFYYFIKISGDNPGEVIVLHPNDFKLEDMEKAIPLEKKGMLIILRKPGA